MEKQKLVMISSKVLNQMLAYRGHKYYYSSYKEACNSIGMEISKFRTDIFRTDIYYYSQISPRPFIRSFQNLLINIAAKCLLAAAECSGEHKLYDEIFDTFFEVMGEMMDQLVEDGRQYFDSAIIEKFENFEDGVADGHANTILLYHIAVYCVFLYNYIEVHSNPIAEEVKK